MVKEKLSKKNWFIITLFCFMGGIAWNTENMYFNTFITNEIYADVSQAAIRGSMEATTAVARMVALSAVAAVLTTFIMGALSDKLKNRKMFISVGYILWGIVTAMFGFITKENVANLLNLNDETKILACTVWFVILMDIVMTFMGSTSNDAAFQAWVTDVTVPRQRPLVETVLSVVGTISSFAVTGVGSFAQAGTVSYKLFFGGLGLIVTLCGVVGLFLIKDPPRTVQTQSSSNYWADLFYGFRPSVIKENSRLYLSLASFCFAIIAFQVFYPYLLTYVQYVVLPDNGGVENILRPGVIVTAVVVLIVTLTCIVTLLKLSTEKKGFCLVTGVIVLSLGFFLLSTSTNIYVILISIVPVVLGNALVNILFGAAVKDFIPEGKAGLFQGIRMIFVVLLPMVIGPVIGDMACQHAAQTILNEVNAEVIVPAKNMFLWAGIVGVLALIPLYFLVKKGFEIKDNKNDAEVNA
ncbi:MAG: MFS transporter [Clostridia bacterium]|nr:MFS transporter [Clostridia bacterium]MBQ4338714.1 MFS transporter [Clostridia bacterium]